MINRISLAECLDQSTPPAKVLDVSVLDDTAFIRICDVGETHDTETHQEVAEISVSLPSLIEALNLLSVDTERERLRPCEDEQAGAHETRLAGRRLTVVPVAPWSAVAALTEHCRYTPEPGKRQHDRDDAEGEAEM
jgi:hypothetical protein